VTEAKDVRLSRWMAALQVILVCGVPTQIIAAVVVLLVTSGLHAENLTMDRLMSLEFTAPLLLLDTALIAVLIRIFLEMSGETSQAVFVGARRPLGEIVRGLLLVPVVLVALQLLVAGIRTLLPVLHTVEESPFEKYIGSPMDAAVFGLVVVLSGGIKEELQRAFILHRFRQRLGGINVGLVAFTLFFGALHATQGVDTAIGIGLLGLLWGVLYIRRGSILMSLANHAGFDGISVAIGALLGE